MSDQYRDALLAVLPACDLPAELVAWLAHGLEVQRAGGSLVEALGLEGPDMGRRDDIIRTAILLSPGVSTAARCAFFVDCLDNNRQHPRKDMQHMIGVLRFLDVPRTTRHLTRIVDNRRQDGWRECGT